MHGLKIPSAVWTALWASGLFARVWTEKGQDSKAQSLSHYLRVSGN
jgi:hypothetical protein